MWRCRAHALLSSNVRLIVYIETDVLGGAEVVTGHLVASLRADFDVVVMGPHARVIEHLASRRPGARAIVMPPMRSRSELRAFLAHRRVLSSLAPAVFQAVLTFPTACQWPLIAARSVTGVTPIAVEHLTPVALTRRGAAARRRLVHTLTAHVAVSRFLARAVERASQLPEGSVLTIPNGVPDVAVAGTHLDVAGQVVGAVGRFEHSKGFDVLIRAIAAVPNVDLVLIGDGDGEAALRALIAELGVDPRVHLPGWSDQPRSLMAGFDLVVVPSRAEAFGLVAVEAMLASRPVVASDVGGLPEVVEHSRTGLLVPPDDPDALSSAIRTLLDDAPRREEMGARGRERALEHFSVVTMTEAYESLYDTLASER
jgi:glycosyltransferase involved in cell wall biosynthesis